MSDHHHTTLPLITFMRHHSPSELGARPDCPSTPQPPRSRHASWLERRSRSVQTHQLSRDESLLALRELSIDLERLSSWDMPTVTHVTHPSQRIRRLVAAVQTWSTVHQRCDLIKQLASEPPTEKSEKSGNALRRLIGHDLPYSWQLAHELNLDPSFEFSQEGLIMPDKGHAKVVALFVRAADRAQQEELAAVLEKIGRKGKASARSLGVVARSLDAISDTLSAISGQPMKEQLDPAYICQMVAQGALGPAQMSELVHAVGKTAAESSMLESPAILGWLSGVDTNCADAPAAARLLHQLLDQLKKHRATEMNVKLALYRPIFRSVGAEFERDQIQLAVSSGALALDRTADWLDRAWQTTNPAGASLQAMKDCHRTAIGSLLEKLSLENKQRVQVSELPETLALDTARLGKFRAEVRRLAVAAALCTLANALLKSAGVRLSPDEQTELKLEVLEQFSQARSKEKLCRNMAEHLQLLAGDCLSKLPGLEALTASLRGSLKRNAGSLRYLFTQRLVATAVHQGPMDKVHGSLAAVEEEARLLATQVDQFCSHLELAYSQLYVALLGSK